MCIAVGNVSLDDCDLLTSSFALINNSPSIFPNLLNWALLAITSLTFILDWVPDPVCQMTKGNSSSNFPSEISSQTVAIASRFSTGSVPNSQLVYAAAFFRHRSRCTDFKIFKRTFGLCTPKPMSRNFYLAHCVFFYSVFHFNFIYIKFK